MYDKNHLFVTSSYAVMSYYFQYIFDSSLLIGSSVRMENNIGRPYSRLHLNFIELEKKREVFNWSKRDFTSSLYPCSELKQHIAGLKYSYFTTHLPHLQHRAMKKKALFF